MQLEELYRKLSREHELQCPIVQIAAISTLKKQRFENKDITFDFQQQEWYHLKKMVIKPILLEKHGTSATSKERCSAITDCCALLITANLAQTPQH